MKSIYLHSLVALLGLGAAFFVWRGERQGRGEDAVAVVDCDVSSFAFAQLTKPKRSVRLERDGDAYWLTVTKTPDDGAPRTSRFLGGDSAKELAESLAPLMANRSLGAQSGDALTPLGLSESESSLTYSCGGNEHTFAVGGSAYGSGDHYVMPADGGAVYLLPTRSLGDFDSAESRLMQRALTTLAKTDVELAVVQFGESEQTWQQRNRRDEDNAEWVDSSAPGRRNEAYGNWLERLEALRAQKYLGADEEPGADLDSQGSRELAFRVTWKSEDGESIDSLEVARIRTASALHYYARSSATRAWVKLTRSAAMSVDDDGREILGLPELDKPVPPAPAPVVEPAPVVAPEAASETGTETETETETGSETE